MVKAERMGTHAQTTKKMPAVKGKYCSGKFARSRLIWWYWDVRMWLPIFLAIIALIWCSFSNRINNLTQENTAQMESIQAEKEELEAKLQSLATEPTVVEHGDTEAVALAKLADSVARGRSDEVKRIVMWVAINRSEDRSNGYGLSLLGEIERPQQWQQYDPDAVYLESTLEIAEEVLEIRDSGGARPIYSDMLWFVLNDDGSITVRNQYQQSKNRAEATFGQE